jgi:hypothetical protein
MLEDVSRNATLGGSMIVSSRSLLVCGVFVSSVAAACSSSSTPSLAPTDVDAGGPLTAFPTTIYLGVDDTGKAIGSAPVGLTGASGTVTWTSGTTTVATATGDAKSGTITGVKAGKSTVTIKAGTKSATVSVTVNTYPAGDIAKGQTEYMMGKCDDCHAGMGPDVTPSDIGKHTDDEIMGAIVQGANPEGGMIAGMHKFTATAAIIAYMRSLPARTNTPVQDD